MRRTALNLPRAARLWGRARLTQAGLAVALMAVPACTKGLPFPWPSKKADTADVITHRSVTTQNANYNRQSSRVLIRAIGRPTRANLDFAAYHSNVMIEELPPTHPPSQSATVTLEGLFGDLIDGATIVASLDETPLSAATRDLPMAFEPMVNYLAAKNHAWATGLEDLRAAVRTESWGQRGGPHILRQRISEAFAQGNGLWVRIEFQPWFKLFADPPDEDGDGYPEIYGQVRSDLVSAEAMAAIDDDYSGRELSPAEIQAWANELASYWYPSYNTDIEPLAGGEAWPDANTDPEVTSELAGLSVAAPTVVIKGKPGEVTLYNVLVVAGVAASTATGSQATRSGAATAATAATPNTDVVSKRIAAELQRHGSWSSWHDTQRAFRRDVSKRLAAIPSNAKALVGRDGFLFYRRSLEHALATDMQQQAAGKNPFAAIVEFRDLLAEAGVDFLFVPVPTKLEVYPDKLAAKHATRAGKIVSPAMRKIIGELAAANVEVVDLLSLYLEDRDKGELLYQSQDTHWTDRGMQLAANVIVARLQQYPWFAGLTRNPKLYTARAVKVNQYGDLHSRLTDRDKGHFKPAELTLQQIVDAKGDPYDDDPSSPVVVLGDSFTGVFQRTPPRGAGFSAQLAKRLGMPVDLVMSYGGGGNIRTKLFRRGEYALKGKRLVMWVMAARDLWDYWEDWVLLGQPTQDTQ